MIERVKVVEIDGVEYLVTEEVKTDPIEFRVYYDEKGTILFYTCEKPEGNYLIIDTQAFAEKRFDLKVIDGKLTRMIPGITIRKYKPDDEGISCASEDLSVVANTDNIKQQKWKMSSYELR